jgi:hypothetical protein
MVCAILAEINRDRKKRNKPFAPEDFMPQKEQPKPKTKATPEQLGKQLEAMTKIMGGREV